MSPAMAFERAHEEALEEGASTYRDPETGRVVFTRLGLEARGSCCGSGCRHCPYAHEAVPMHVRAGRIARPAMLHGEPPTGGDVLFWSGGKDSLLALRAHVRAHGIGRAPTLLTTFDARLRIVAHQELPIETLARQARALDLPMLGVPLHSEASYEALVHEGLMLLGEVRRLVFGDLHLEGIRRWREDVFQTLLPSARLAFPLWGRSPEALLDELEACGVDARVCASPDWSRVAPVKAGDRFDATLIDRLPAGIDPFGENGEFHTEVCPESLSPSTWRDAQAG